MLLLILAILLVGAYLAVFILRWCNCHANSFVSECSLRIESALPMLLTDRNANTT